MPVKTQIAAALVVCCFFSIGSADDWPQWLGPKGDAVWSESGLIESFPEEGAKILWRTPVGPGYSGPAVAGNLVFITDRTVDKEQAKKRTNGLRKITGTERVFCLDRTTGKEAWKHEYRCDYQISYPSGPRTTPLIEEDRVYTLGAMGHLFCFEKDSGQIKWSKNLLEAYEAKPPIWGYAAHPMIDGNKLICLVGGEDAAVVAFDKMTGKEIWRSKNAQEVGYAPPVLYEPADGPRQLIVWMDVAICGLDPESGKQYWSIDFPKKKPQRPVVTIMTPRIYKNQLLVSNYYDGSIAMELGSNPPSAKELWCSDPNDQRRKDDLTALMTTPFVRDGLVYGVSGKGEMLCMKLETGDLVWRDFAPLEGKKADFATGFIVANQDKFYIFNDLGELVIAKMDETQYTELSRAKVLERTSAARGRKMVWSHPAFASGCMFARNDKEIVCVDLRKDTQSK